MNTKTQWMDDIEDELHEYTDGYVRRANAPVSATFTIGDNIVGVVVITGNVGIGGGGSG
ncbi:MULTISPECIES: hypothetical protein [unclassified Streptomyces]|uniref:hypothetical protein n=1 Tax=unclassified Streptomyces TaxID=2593676 RepID=UPI0019084B6C|nr:hypothetical protein [Streptomyces sp. HSG2]